MSIRRTLIALVGAVSLTAMLGACVTPTIPIPPPSPESMSFSVAPMDGTARFAYDSEPTYADAVVYVFNRDKGTGVITTANADGSVDPTDPFAGDGGDEIIVSFELEGQLGSTCVRLAEGQSSSANECSP